jgi:hypothetical protein
LLFACLIVTACAHAPNEDVFEQADKALGTTRPDWDNPGPLQRMIQGNPSAVTEEKIQQTEQRITQLERQLQEQQSKPASTADHPQDAQSASAPRIKIGLLLKEATPESLGNPLQNAIRDSAPDYPVSLVATHEIQDQLHGSGCKAENIAACLEKLAVYPGLRMLALIDHTQPASSSAAIIRITLADTAYGVIYPSFPIELPTANGHILPTAMRDLANKVLRGAVDRTQFAPWTTRAFSNKGERWYLAAGNRSGLKAGDFLEITAPGDLVKTPSGLPAGWIPGYRKGTLRIESLVGDDIAVAQLVEGQPPTPNDPILLSQQVP